jgi:hypothetical protein
MGGYTPHARGRDTIAENDRACHPAARVPFDRQQQLLWSERSSKSSIHDMRTTCLLVDSTPLCRKIRLLCKDGRAIVRPTVHHTNTIVLAAITIQRLISKNIPPPPIIIRGLCNKCGRLSAWQS